jgi:hypothetical protein
MYEINSVDEMVTKLCEHLQKDVIRKKTNPRDMAQMAIYKAEFGLLYDSMLSYVERCMMQEQR